MPKKYINRSIYLSTCLPVHACILPTTHIHPTSWIQDNHKSRSSRVGRSILLVQCTLLWQPIIHLEELKPPIWISNKIMQRPEIGSSVYNLYQANLHRTENRNVIKGDRKTNQKRRKEKGRMHARGGEIHFSLPEPKVNDAMKKYSRFFKWWL